MTQVVLNIKDGKAPFFFELIKNFNFIKVEKTITDNGPNKEQVLQGIKQGLKEVKLIEQGKLKAKPLKDFINEL